MTVFFNGEFLPEAAARVPLTDRGWLFGDAVFETLRTHRGRPLFWAEHLARFRRGAAALGIRVSATDADLATALQTLLVRNQVTDAAVRLTLSWGSGPRGYSPRGADRPTLALTVHPAPELFGGATGAAGWDLVTSHHRLPPADELSPWKHANRLLSVLARAEAEAAGAHEALLLSYAGHVAEAAGANVFWLDRAGTMCTPPAETGALPGVTQAGLRRLFAELGWPCETALADPDRLRAAAGVFLTNSLSLLIPVRSLDGCPLPRAALITEIQAEIRTRWLPTEADSGAIAGFSPPKG